MLQDGYAPTHAEFEPSRAARRGRGLLRRAPLGSEAHSISRNVSPVAGLTETTLRVVIWTAVSIPKRSLRGQGRPRHAAFLEENLTVSCGVRNTIETVSSVKTLNEVYSSLSTRRRYEVWFLRLGLADGQRRLVVPLFADESGARVAVPKSRSGMPVQVWATWFPRDGKPQSFIQGFPIDGAGPQRHGIRSPFHLRIGGNGIEENSCRGALEVDGHTISWDLRYRSTFRVTLSNKGWIGFSRSPHSDAMFSGQITLDGQHFEG